MTVPLRYIMVLLMGLAAIFNSAATAQDWNPRLCLQQYEASVSVLRDSSEQATVPGLMNSSEEATVPGLMNSSEEATVPGLMNSSEEATVPGLMNSSEEATVPSLMESPEAAICPILVRLKDCLLHFSLSVPGGPDDNMIAKKAAVLDIVQNKLVDKELRRHGVNCNIDALSPSPPRRQRRHSPLQPTGPMGRPKRTSHSVQKRSALAVKLAVKLAMDPKTMKCVRDNLVSTVLDLDNFCENALSMTTCAFRGKTLTAAQALVPVVQHFLEDLFDEFQQLCDIDVVEILAALHKAVKLPLQDVLDFIEDEIIDPILDFLGLGSSGPAQCLPHPWLVALSVVVLAHVLFGFWVFG